MRPLSLFSSIAAVLIWSAPQALSASPDAAEKCLSEAGDQTSCVGHPLRSDLRFHVDAGPQRIQAEARLDFRVASQAQRVWFLFDPTVASARLDGELVTTQRRKTPDGEQWIVSLPLKRQKATHQLELSYKVTGLTKWGLQWQPFRWVTDYSDSSDARFFNAFAPGSYEADRYPMIWSFEVTGLKRPLQVYSSATGISRSAANRVELSFDARSNLSAPYFELGETRYQVRDFSYRGLYQPIPVRVYLDPAIGQGRSAASMLNQAEKLTRSTLAQFETRFGPYAFAQLLLKVYSLQTGDLPLTQEYSMEYGGAAVSRMELIPHELCHQWFGRGASPADGRAGFADEVVCDWYDYAHRSMRPTSDDTPAKLMPASPWTLRTPEEAYQEGHFMGGVEWLLAQRKLSALPRLRDFYLRYRQSSYSGEDFLKALNPEGNPTLQAFLARQALGK